MRFPFCRYVLLPQLGIAAYGVDPQHGHVDDGPMALQVSIDRKELLADVIGYP